MLVFGSDFDLQRTLGEEVLDGALMKSNHWVRVNQGCCARCSLKAPRRNQHHRELQDRCLQQSAPPACFLSCRLLYIPLY
jgi:hypothetical protein